MKTCGQQKAAANQVTTCLWLEETLNTDGSEKVKSEDRKGLEGINLVVAGSDEHRSAALRHLI